MKLVWIEFVKGYDQWKPGDKCAQADSKAQNYITLGLAKECDAPTPKAKVPQLSVESADAPPAPEKAVISPEPRRRGRPPMKKDGDE